MHPDETTVAEKEANTTVSSVSTTAAEADSGQFTGTAPDQSYQSLYTDLYCEKSGEEIVEDHTVYLTFDDGPSRQTQKILDILKENNIKATFFVTGKTDSASLDSMRRIVEEGHTLGVHSYTHIYRQVYRSVGDYLEDFYNTYILIYTATGIKPSIYRFPGGSINSFNKDTYQDIIDEMNRRGFTYFDWNVSSSDTNSSLTPEDIADNVLTGVSQHTRSIVLYHDSNEKNATVESLDGIIKELKAQGYAFNSLSNNIKPIVFVKH